MPCPECGTEVPVTLHFQSARLEDSILIADLEPDLTDVMVHAWTHEQGQARPA
jgi:hypothetical protein